MPVRPTIELISAWFFTCDECGRDVLVYGTTLDESIGPDDLQRLKDEHGIEPYEQGEWITQPVEVACCYCNAEYDVEIEPQGDQ